MIQTIMTNDVPLTALDRQIFDATVPADHYTMPRAPAPSISAESEPSSSSPLITRPLGRPPFDPLVLRNWSSSSISTISRTGEVINRSQVEHGFRLFL